MKYTPRSWTELDTALRLGRLFGTTPQFWLNLQTRYDLLMAQGGAADLDAIEPIPAAA